jgi:dTMP kinase
MVLTADRRQQRPRVEAALRRGTIVLQDRSFYSTLAYQGSALSVERQRALARIQREATLEPDWVVLLDLPVELSEARMRPSRAWEPTERPEVLRRASRAYRRFARSRRWIVLDARRTPEQVLAEVDRRLTPWILGRRSAGRART